MTGLVAKTVPQEERYRFLPTHSFYMVRMILCMKAGFIICGESGISRLVLSALKITFLEINFETTPRKDLLFSYLISRI